MLKEYGIKSLAMQNLAKLVKAVAEYSDTAHAHYDERIHVFGKLSGMLDPYDYRAVEVDLIMDYLLELMNRDANSVDENMNSAQPFFDTENATELLSSLFKENNMSMPESTEEKIRQRPFSEGGTGQTGQAGETNEMSGRESTGAGLIHIDHLLEIAHDEWKEAVAQRELELAAVFKSYDADGDGNLDLAEFTRIVSDIDTCSADSLNSLYVSETPRSQKQVHEMYNMAVDLDDDDDDEISPEAFIDVCYVHNLGIGVHPLRREEMIKAAARRKGQSSA